MKKQKTNVWLDKELKRTGRKRKWISEQLGISRQHFWRKADERFGQAFTDSEIKHIKKLLK